MNKPILGGLTILCMVTSMHSGSSASKPLQRFEYLEIEMGVAARIVAYAPNEATAKRACAAAFDRVADLEDKMSDYRPTSELMRLCAKADGPPVAISPELFIVLQNAQTIAKQSGGAFDVTVGPFVGLWRTARKTKQMPTSEDLKRAQSFVGWRNLRLDPKRRTAQLLVPGMKLDLGGIAKGYAGDEAIAMLKRNGITRAMFEAGGDIVASDPPPGQTGWEIEILNAPKGLPRTRRLANAAISTSGDTMQFVEIGRKRYSHVVDPHTGIGLTDRIAVTVIASRGMTSDALSTALSVMGPIAGKTLAKQYPGLTAYFRTVRDRGPASRL